MKLNKKVNSLTNRDTFVSLYFFALLDGELYQVGATERRVRRLLCGAVFAAAGGGSEGGYTTLSGGQVGSAVVGGSPIRPPPQGGCHAGWGKVSAGGYSCSV